MPFDLVYTEYDRSRIINYDHNAAISKFGAKSAESFRSMRDDLLNTLERYLFKIVSHTDAGDVESNSYIYVRKNVSINKLSGRKSCPYLTYSDDRYYCGVHPFKPLHCWYPHMVIRSDSVPDPMRDSASVMIGRMQYGRNHNFGCPVVFVESSSGRKDGLFEDVTSEKINQNYLDSQFEDDYGKLSWTSKSAITLGFNKDNSFVVDMPSEFLNKRGEIANRLLNDEKSTLVLWRNNERSGA